MSFRYNSSDSKRYFDWLFHANLDFLAAKNLINDERCYFAAAFHCQQCIEKALKAFLLFENRRLYDGHNLTWLCKQAIMKDPHFRQFLDESAWLNRYYIETRYPADIGLDITFDSMQKLLKITGEMLSFISLRIKFDFVSYHKSK